jgi:hypothetical protein
MTIPKVPAELLAIWQMQTPRPRAGGFDIGAFAYYIANNASQWAWKQREPEIQKAADEEFEACLEFARRNFGPYYVDKLRENRRPTLSKKEEALKCLGPRPLPIPSNPGSDYICNGDEIKRWDSIYKALTET